MKKIVPIILFLLFLTPSAFSEVTEEIVFNKKGEVILLKNDGTWINKGKPDTSNGIIIRNVALLTKDYLVEGEKRQKCEVKVELINNTPIDIKKFGLSYKVYDDYNNQKIYLFAGDSFGYKIKPGTSVFLKHIIPKNCDKYFEGGWYIVGDVNPFTIQAKDPSITKDEILKYVVWSNDGVLPFKN
tara:strand:- start:55 stop:609 length:555 start_codon:yes stop_codon:yes gene_type:complete